MLSFKALWAMFWGDGTRGYPIGALSKRQTRFQKFKGIVPPVLVVFSADRGCKMIRLSQAEFAERYCL